MTNDVPVTSLVIVVRAVLVLLCGQTDTHRDADECITPTPLVGESNECIVFIVCVAVLEAKGRHVCNGLMSAVDWMVIVIDCCT